MSNPATQWHWCWGDATRERAQVRGLPTQCSTCQRNARSHRCGFVEARTSCRKDYPVSDCGACSRVDVRELSDGPSATLVPAREIVDGPAPEGEQYQPPEKRTGVRRKQAATKAKRMRLLVLAASRGDRTQPELAAVLAAFDVTCSRHALYNDLDELVDDAWLMRVRVPMAKVRGTRDWQWTYRVNPSIVELL